MNVLVIGRGGREHSIIMKLAQSEEISSLYVAPGNPGMGDFVTYIPIEEMEIAKLVDFAKQQQIDLTIVGPEAPLMTGIVNEFQAAGLRIFAPRKEAALIEGSKSFAKEVMKKYQIPTAEYETFTDPSTAKKYVEAKGVPIVIKADGLAAGKGVVIAETIDVAFQVIDDMLVSNSFREAGAQIVIEEFLEGSEFSLMAFVNGENVFPLIPAKDHKRVYDDDLGPNTGGMGAYAPVFEIPKEIITISTREILEKTATALVKEGRSFTGILYAGLMLTDQGPKVIEFNARFGDPETQVVLPLLKNDLLQVVLDVLDGKNPNLVWEKKTCLGVVLASEGYPSNYIKGTKIPSFKKSSETFIAYAGIEKTDAGFVSNGGRVLLVGAKGTSLAEAGRYVYSILPHNHRLEGLFYRTDIGKIGSVR
ncbi:phosphoribosylamine--glycine ligase [Ornithinibacillus bavariensis]|uniref:Phosphoribosylamine--glycine ligase n=1 Tax=Ornithinibacillus bavariensis TaxID=545502 RepID=A0A919X8K8_9BACI|nr:phosphoribosylamine--glycine ligase [Ornithinibacillus bavariensis]GIO28011.1 phosphoribosylamine--glycine ligase [Ornithinibacillus bavariensis]